MPFRKINATNTKGVLVRSPALQSDMPHETRQCRIKMGKFQCDVSVSGHDGFFTVTYHATNTVIASFVRPTATQQWLVMGGWCSSVHRGVPTRIFVPGLSAATPAKLFDLLTKHLRALNVLY